MPTSYTDQFFAMDPAAPPPAGTVLNFVSLTITDENDDGDFDRFDDDSLNGVDITASFPGDTVTINVAGVGNVTYTGVTFYLADGTRFFTPSDGQVLQNGTLVSTTFVFGQGPLLASELGPPCFLSGTLIETPDGLKAIETLVEGDIVVGFAGDELTLRRVLHRRIDTRELHANPKLQPVRIMAGALGDGLPKNDLFVSRQHRMLVRSKITERMFGETEVLISAIKLTELPGISVVQSMNDVEYFHLVFDKHEVIYAEGSPTESLFPGPEALKAISQEAREEILTIFPEVADLDYAPTPARFIPPGKQQKQLIARHLKNNQPLLSQSF